MAWKVIIEWALAILALIAFGVMLYFKYKGDLHAVVCQLIALAEATGLPGKDKMDTVVTHLYDGYVPTFLKKIFTPEKIREYAQRIFDWMRLYANNYLISLKTGCETVPETKKDVE